MDHNVIEMLAMEIHHKMISNKEYKDIIGEEKPSWSNEAEHNRDDYRRMAKISIDFLWRLWN